tara:strand:- start:627 stop:764 length:138 start_codon:yes stop_codon:yes gene_type:complete
VPVVGRLYIITGKAKQRQIATIPCVKGVTGITGIRQDQKTTKERG